MRVFKGALVIVVLSACLPLARADDIPWGLNPALNDTIFIGLGTFYAAKVSTTAQLNSQKLGVGTVIDFQNTLGLAGTAWGPDARVSLEDERAVAPGSQLFLDRSNR